jgi:hypothetical protein
MKEGALSLVGDVNHDIVSYCILFPTNIRYLYVDGKFKRTGLVFLSPDGRGDVWMLKIFKDIQKLYT